MIRCSGIWNAHVSNTLLLITWAIYKGLSTAWLQESENKEFQQEVIYFINNTHDDRLYMSKQ